MSKVKVQEAAKKMVDEAQALLANVQVTKRLLGDTIERLNRLEDVRMDQEARLIEERRQAELQLKGQEPAKMMSAYVMSDDEGGGFEGFVEPVRADSPQPPAEADAPVGQAGMPAASAALAQDAAAQADAATAEKNTAAQQDRAPETAPPAVEKPAADASASSDTVPSEKEKAVRAEPLVRHQTPPADRPPRQERPAGAERPRAPQTDARAMPPRPAGTGTGMGGTGPRPGGMPPRPAGMGTGMGGTGPRAPGAPAPGGRPFTPRDGRPAPGGAGPRPFPPRDGRPAGPGGAGPRPFPPRDGRPAAPGGARPGMGGAGGRPGFGRQRGPELTPAQEKERVSNYDPNKSTYQRQHDPEKKAQRPKKAVAKETIAAAGGLDDDFRNRKRRPSKKIQQRIEPIVIDKAFMTAETITVKDLTERIGKPAGEIIKKLLLLGIMATINQELDYDTALLVCQEFGVELQLKLEKTYEETLADEGVDDKPEDLKPRPPVVTIMGHVDHGKTSLLDAIRKTNVVEGEAGGITQRIGAYTVDINGRSITFIDTPGHEAFTSMRMRGAQATDIAVLVVAADDGIMPQTVEAINHAKAAEVPIIVAINKMDRPGANPERIKQELTNHNLVAEEWGGDTVIAEVSAVTRMGLDNLLELILLSADVRELNANPNRKARGVIIEAQLDKGRGPVATVLVQSGTLKIGDTIVAGTAYGRVRAMVDDKGKRITEAGPSIPVEVIGFSDVPEAGDAIAVVEDDRLSRQVAEERRDKQRAQQIKAAASVTLEDLFSQISAGEVKDLNLIVKADVQGSVEAVRQSLERLSNEEVKVSVVHGGVGAISISDVMLATTSKAIIIGFNVRPDASAREMAEREKIDVRMYRVIYQAIEDIEAAMKGMLAPIFKEVVLGHAEIRQVYRISGVGAIAGCYITDGVVRRNADVRLLRDNTVIFEGKLDSLKRFKDDAREVAQGFECGIGLERYNDIKESDVIECFVNEEVAR